MLNVKTEEHKNPYITHEEGAKSRHRREIADGYCISTFAKVYFVGIFGINSENIIIFLELIPKKLYFCSDK
jgi:hypothetical protein